mmetsp:Transcript_2305/g.7121  ORF Transcript_2305/g.7121 Transcript_2305/m.7121 type:complete len:484 (-) Transcript_2305:51-1502(-)
MHWIASSLILYAFAVPSSITGVAYTFNHSGVLLGSVMCILATAASACGALLLLKLILGAPQGHRRPRMFSDLGALATGRISGANAALCLQLTNFVLYQPVALLTTASAMQDAVQPEGETCTNYFIFLVSLVCFAGTQCRELKYASLLAGIALAAGIGVAGLQIYIAAAYSPDHGDTHGKGVGDHENRNRGFEVVWDKPGPPDPSSSRTASVEMALSLTTAIWAYVPSLLIAELAFEMESPEHLSRSIALSAGLNVATFLAVGLSVWCLWEGGVDDPITLSEGWPRSSFAGRLLSSLLCLSNFVGYCLDSVPLARWCQRRFVPRFSGQWDMRSVGRYALISAPAWVFGVLVAVFVGSPSGLFVMLSWATALTVPACNLIFPSIFTLCALGPPPPAARSQAALTRSLMSDVEAPTPGRCIRQSITRTEGAIAACVLLWGLFALVICTYAAIGKTFDPIVRGPQVIGCEGWGIYKSEGTEFRGFGW